MVPLATVTGVGDPRQPKGKLKHHRCALFLLVLYAQYLWCHCRLFRSIHFAIYELSARPDSIDEGHDVIALWLTIEVILNPLSPPLDNSSHYGLRNPSTEVLSDYKQQVHLRPNSKSFSTDSELCCLRHCVNRVRFQNQKACANTFLIAASSTHCYCPHRNGHHWQAGSQVQ